LPRFHIPIVPFNWETLCIVLPYAIIVVPVGLIERLLTFNLVGKVTGDCGGAHLK